MISAFTLFQDFWRERWAVWRLFKDDMIIRTRGSHSSIAWNLIFPLVPLGFYIILTQLQVFPAVDGTMDRLTFVSIGVTLWMLFSSLIAVPMNEMRAVLKELETMQFSVLSQLVIRLSQVFFDTIIRLIAVYFIISFMSTDSLHINLFFVPILLITMVCCLGVGIFLGLLSLAFGDLKRLISVILQYGIFVSGAIFPVAQLGGLSTLMNYNPLFLALDSIRSLLVFGVYQPNFIFWAAIILGVAVFLWALTMLFILQDELRGRL